MGRIGSDQFSTLTCNGGHSTDIGFVAHSSDVAAVIAMSVSARRPDPWSQLLLAATELRARPFIPRRHLAGESPNRNWTKNHERLGVPGDAAGSSSLRL